MGTESARIIMHSHANESNKPVSTARYIVDVVMNEEYPSADRTNEKHVEHFAWEFQRALDAGFFTDLRYDAMDFTVTRFELDRAPAGDPEPGERIIALLNAQGTACAETALYGDEDTPERRAEVERDVLAKDADGPILNTWTNVSDNDALTNEED